MLSCGLHFLIFPEPPSVSLLSIPSNTGWRIPFPAGGLPGHLSLVVINRPAMNGAEMALFGFV
jgi:hypothetical protein